MLNIAIFSSSPLTENLLNILSTHFSLKLIITNADRPVGRKATLTPSKLKVWAQQKNIEYLTPTTLKNEQGDEVLKKLIDLSIDLSIVIDYGLLIPERIFNVPREKTLNIHFSKLPKFRGPYPDAFVKLSGEKETTISFVIIDKGYDTGDIISQTVIPTTKDETAFTQHERLFQKTGEILPYIINKWDEYNTGNKNIQNTLNMQSTHIFLPPQKQDHSKANYTKILNRDDGFISWETLTKIVKNEDISWNDLPKLIQENVDGKDLDKKQIFYNFFLALSPWPGVWTIIKTQKESTKRLKILDLEFVNNNIQINKVQIEGKNPISWKEFCKYYCPDCPDPLSE